jgi:hypothetical protein
VLFYLGPELIAALLGAYEGTRENSQASCGLSRPSVDERDVTQEMLIRLALFAREDERRGGKVFKKIATYPTLLA